MLKRLIPSSGELLPVIGLGTWKQFDIEALENLTSPLKSVLNLMQGKGARLIDTSPMYGKSEFIVGELTGALENRNDYFYATKIWTEGEQQGIKQLESSFNKMKRVTMDLVQVHNLLDLKTQLKTINKWKAEGKIRYSGITHYKVSEHKELERVIREEKPDFVQFNYSIRVRDAEKRLLKTAMDHGTAVIINEPFERGDLFRLTGDRALPAWASEFGIHTWSQFYLKYILSEPAVTCVIPGTSVPAHMDEILMSGFGRLPGEGERKKMVQFIEGL